MKRPLLWVVIIFILFSIFVGMVNCGGSESEPFRESDITGKTVAEAVEVVEPYEYDVKVVSITGVELSNDFDSMSSETLNRWFVEDCEISHSEKSIEIQINLAGE